MPDRITTTTDIASSLARDSAIITASTKTTVWGYFSTVLAFLGDYGTAVFIGTLITVAGFVINVYFQRKRNKRETALNDAREERESEEHRWKSLEHLARIRMYEERMDDAVIRSMQEEKIKNE